MELSSQYILCWLNFCSVHGIVLSIHSLLVEFFQDFDQDDDEMLRRALEASLADNWRMIRIIFYVHLVTQRLFSMFDILLVQMDCPEWLACQP